MFFDGDYPGFDFDGDGDVDMFESYVSYRMVTDDDEEDGDDDEDDSGDWSLGDDEDEDDDETWGRDLLSGSATSWRDDCEDGSQYDLDPDDFDTLEEYEEALEEAREGWRVDAVLDGLDYDLDPDDFDTLEEFEEALEEARDQAEAAARPAISLDGPNDVPKPHVDALGVLHATALSQGILGYDLPELDVLAMLPCAALGIAVGARGCGGSAPVTYPNQRMRGLVLELADRLTDDDDYAFDSRRRCEFALKNPEVVAARYLTKDGGYLYAQAVKEHFVLPIDVPAEDEKPKTRARHLFKALARKDARLAVDVWAWLVETFVPYVQYAEEPNDEYVELTAAMFYEFRLLPEAVRAAVFDRLQYDDAFRRTVLVEAPELPWDFDELLSRALLDGRAHAAGLIVQATLDNPATEGSELVDAVESALCDCIDREDLELTDAFKTHVLALVAGSSHVAIMAEVPQWEERLDDHYREMEEWNPKYRYSYGNAWRTRVPSGAAYGVDPLEYLSEKDYLAALEQARREAEAVREKEKAVLARAAASKVAPAAQAALPVVLADPECLFRFVGVVFQEGGRPYAYRCDDKDVDLGDCVIVPVGTLGEEKPAKVVSVTRCVREGAPFSPDRCKHILRKADA